MDYQGFAQCIGLVLDGNGKLPGTQSDQYDNDQSNEQQTYAEYALSEADA